MEAVIFIGIQAAGKSTFYHQRFFNTHVRINLDMLKTRHRERILLDACLVAKQPFVVDNTNVSAEARAKYIELSKAADFRVIGYYFQSSLGEAIERNRRRALAKPIPERAIAATSKRLELPSPEEGFDELYHVTVTGPNEFTVRRWNEK
jgi:predicted kinase